MEQPIFSFDRDDDGDWRAKLICGHYQHVRHKPPLISREWVLLPEGRATRVGKPLQCKKCDDLQAVDFDIPSLLEDDHSCLDDLLDSGLTAIDSGDTDRVFPCVDIFWARLAMHIRAEHLHLFPAILNASKLSNEVVNSDHAEKTIEDLHNDHDLFMRRMIDAIKHLREGTEDLQPVRVSLEQVRERLKTHNQTEESEVYGWAEKLLTSEDYKILEKKMLKELINLPPRFSN